MGQLPVLFVTAFVDMVGLAMIVPLLPYYATEFGANAKMVGVLVSAFSVAQLLVAPVWGRFSDRYGRRPAILAGLVLSAAAFALFGFADSVLALLVSRVVQGLGGGTIAVVQAYVADASSPAERTKSLGWLSAVTSLGAVFGPMFGSVAAAIGGRHAPGIAAAILSLVVAAFAWRFLQEPKPATTTSGSNLATTRLTSRQAVGRVLLHWGEPASRLIWIYAVGIGAFYGTIQIAPLLLLDRFGVTERNVGYFVAYLGGMGVLVRSLVLGRIVDALGEPRLARLGIVLLSAGLAATGLAHGWPLLLAGFTLMPLGTAFLFPCVTGLLSGAVRSAERGLFMGVQHTFGGVSRVVFPIAAGILIDRFDVGVPYWVAGLCTLATLPLTRGMARAAGRDRKAVADATAAVPAAQATGEFPVPPLQSR
ncbi:MAG TPA: MFS transporter [Gemmatimonadales bacterium]|jgi:MFS family permease|nr:MFS transporter [Gemmatimonadales bacterium]